MSVLSRPYFHDETEAFAFVEGIIWPTGPVCPHCGGFERITAIAANPAKRVRYGLKKCGQCKCQFTVRMGTIFEESKLPMTKWLQAIFLMTASKKGVSSHQLHRTLEVTYKTAWFLARRVREAMRSGELAPLGPGGGIVEADEMFIGVEPGEPITRGGNHKMKVLAPVDRTTGEKRSFVLDFVNARVTGEGYAGHGHTNHAAGEYVSRFNPLVHTNTVEGSFSNFKRGMRGVYQHCSKKHLHRYPAEFDFRYNHRTANGWSDTERAEKLLRGVIGKRLTYETTCARA